MLSINDNSTCVSLYVRIWHLFGLLLVEIKKFFDEIAGVYFPKYLRDICLQLKICGWVKNSKTGTILGKMQGHRALVDQM